MTALIFVIRSLKRLRVFMFIVGVICLALSSAVSAETPAPIPFRVMTYNIHHGEGLDKKLDLNRITELIQRERADIVGLQEVDKGVERTARRDLPAELAKLTGMTCVFSNNFSFQGGEYGNAVLTRFPVVTWTNRHYKMLREGEPRGILQTTLKVQGRDLLFLNTHIDFHPGDEERLSNVREIKEIISSAGQMPVILTGDFNCTPKSEPYAQLSKVLVDSWREVGKGDGFTIPASKPNKRIDFIWYLNNRGILPVRAWVPVTEASDHRPVVVEFTIRRQP